MKPKTETRSERLARYEATSTRHSYLSRPVGHPDLGYLNVETRLLKNGERLHDDTGAAVPVLLDQRAGNELVAFVDTEHEVFKRFGADYADLLLAELAPLLKVRSRSQWAPSQLLAGIRAESLKDSALDGTTVGAEARDLLNEIRSRAMAELNSTGAYREVFDRLTEEEQHAIESSMIASGRVGAVGSLGEDAGFITYLPRWPWSASWRPCPRCSSTATSSGARTQPMQSPAARSPESWRWSPATLADVATIGTFADEATVLHGCGVPVSASPCSPTRWPVTSEARCSCPPPSFVTEARRGSPRPSRGRCGTWGFHDVRVVDGANDHGADLLAVRNREQWVFQSKWKAHGTADHAGVDDLERARTHYRADKAVLATNTNITATAGRVAGTWPVSA
ncbi:restriction endonuclease [Streptomyces thinghirensis]|nr:restriction endonuclease [Streptomyces thinghirensis]